MNVLFLPPRRREAGPGDFWGLIQAAAPERVTPVCGVCVTRKPGAGRAGKIRMDSRTLEAILDSINSPIVFEDNDHVIRFLNKPARALFYNKFGYPDLVGKSLFDCHQPASHDAIRRLYARLREGEDEIFVRVIQNRLKLTAVAVRDPAGTLIGYYERYDKAVEPPGAPRTDSPESARSEKR
jgi:PAS domain-containing protein